MTTERMKRRNLFVRTVLILLILAMPLTSCRQNEPTGQGTEESTEATGIMDGFTVGDGDESLCITCAYKSDKTVFDIDDVTLTFYYGGDFYDSLELELEKGYNIPWFELYFKDENGKKYFIRRVEENLVSEKYRMTYVRDQEKQHATRSYNHSEVLTMPKEVFIKDRGEVFFAIYADDVNDRKQGVEWISGLGFYYKVVANKVILSRTWID